MIVKPGDKIRLYPEERTGQKAIGWKVEYRREYNEYDIIPVTRNWNTNEAKSQFKLVTNGSPPLSGAARSQSSAPWVPPAAAVSSLSLSMQAVTTAAAYGAQCEGADLRP